MSENHTISREPSQAAETPAVSGHPSSPSHPAHASLTYASRPPSYPTHALSYLSHPPYASPYPSHPPYATPHPSHPSYKTPYPSYAPAYTPASHPYPAAPASTVMPSSGAMITSTGMVLPTPATEESYVENILRMNLGKQVTIYMTFENNREWNAKIFKGVLEAAGRDHIIISDPATGIRYLLLMINLDYITFDEPLNYQLPFGMTAAPSPRDASSAP